MFYNLLSSCSVEKNCEFWLVHCLKKPFEIQEPSMFDPERDTVLFDELYETEGVEPKQFEVKRSLKRMYWQYN